MSHVLWIRLYVKLLKVSIKPEISRLIVQPAQWFIRAFVIQKSITVYYWNPRFKIRFFSENLGMAMVFKGGPDSGLQRRVRTQNFKVGFSAIWLRFHDDWYVKSYILVRKSVWSSPESREELLRKALLFFSKFMIMCQTENF